MPFHIDWDSGDSFAIWRDFHGPLIALGVALALVFAGRVLRSSLLAAAAGGTGVVAGWFAISGRRWDLWPRSSVDRLTLLAAVALVIGLLAERLGRSRGVMVGLLLTGVFTGWWLGGAPRSQPDLLQDWPTCVAVGIASLLYARSLATDAPRPFVLAITGLTMAASFHVVMLPSVWIQLALVPAAASVALFAMPALSGLTALPVGADIAAVAGLAVISFGRLPHLRVGPIEVAALAPLLALWI